MLHYYQTASKRQISCIGQIEERLPDLDLLTLLYSINSWLDAVPSVYRSEGGKTVYIVYNDTAFMIDDFISLISPSLAVISRSWKACAFGTASNQETVRLFAKLLPSTDVMNPTVEVVQQSISGKEADSLQTLCLQIECPENETIDGLYSLLSHMNWQTNISVMEWKKVNSFWEQKLIDPNIGSCFCYISVESHIIPDDCLRSLSFPQKLVLWEAFLKEKLEPVEFEWLADEISEGTLRNRMEWELALREIMKQLHFRVINQENSFELFDGAGKRLYFGSDCRSAAERVLLKILFPLNL